ncbi:MAG: hypothetical protein UX68_C0013G0018 [Parcubacteria group bacterium GW2011_GWA2_46_9]|nr:MAG: hypothetical protein UX68_C0013G0018 [Parcubacteria group bacterium GW2011_GWA2_46_9]
MQFSHMSTGSNAPCELFSNGVYPPSQKASGGLLRRSSLRLRRLDKPVDECARRVPCVALAKQGTLRRVPLLLCEVASLRSTSRRSVWSGATGVNPWGSTPRCSQAAADGTNVVEEGLKEAAHVADGEEHAPRAVRTARVGSGRPVKGRLCARKGRGIDCR